MRPERFDPTGRRAAPRDVVVPLAADLALDAELAALVNELEVAGERARTAQASHPGRRPEPAFAASLRGRLIGAYGTASAASRPGAAFGAASDAASRGPDPAEAGVRPAPSFGPRSLVPRSLVPPVVPGRGRLRVAERGGVDVAPRPVGPTVRGRVPRVLPAPRWTALTVAAALILTVLGIRATYLVPDVAVGRATDVAAATLVRDGEHRPLIAGAELRTGDEIRVADHGRATLALLGGRTRLDGGAIVSIEALGGDRVVLDQRAGRVYHRVGPAASTYEVATAGVRWTASGTAFDLDRRAPTDRGPAAVAIVAVEHDVRVSGESLQATIGQGHRAIVRLGSALDVVAVPVGDATLSDRWLLRNAGLDRSLGFGLGIFAGVDLAPSDPTPAPTPPTTPSGPPTAGAPTEPAGQATYPPPAASPTPEPTPTRTPAPTVKPTPKATPKPTPTPTQAPTPPPPPEVGTLGLAATGCNGGVVLDWTRWEGDAFDHYAVVRSDDPTIPSVYPPDGGDVVVGTAHTSDRAKTSSYDLAPTGAIVHYRAFAFEATDRIVAASETRSATAKPVNDLGVLSAGPIEGGTGFAWTPYGGPGACFTYYKLVYSPDDPTPSYLEGATAPWAGGERATAAVTLEGLPAGTWWFRVQAIRATDLGKFVVAETAPLRYAVP